MKIKNDNELWIALNRAKQLAGAATDSPEGREFNALTEAISYYEASRFPIPF